MLLHIKPFPHNKILDFQLKEFADSNFKLYVNGITFSKLVENTVGKGEIACYKQFLLFPQCFQKTCSADTYKPGLVWERVNPLQSQVLTTLKKTEVCVSSHGIEFMYIF